MCISAVPLKHHVCIEKTTLVHTKIMRSERSQGVDGQRPPLCSPEEKVLHQRLFLNKAYCFNGRAKMHKLFATGRGNVEIRDSVIKVCVCVPLT